MTEPTSYDLIQDTRLDALEGVLADVTVPGEGEVSFPVAQQGMDTTMWQQLFRGFGTGVLDLGSYPYRLTSSDTPGSGTITIHPEGKGPAQAVIEGFFHRLPTAKTFTIPAVSSATTFTIALQYDPTQHQRPGGPIVLGLFSGQLDRTQGRKYVSLWEGVRRPSTVVSQMTWVQKRHRVVPTIHVASQEYLPDPNSDGLLWGTRALARTGADAIEYQLIGTTGSLRWDAVQPATAAGSVTVTMSNSANGTATITFPTGRFNAPPSLFLTKQGDSMAKAIPYARNVTNTGAVVGLYTGDGAPYNSSVAVAWRAYQQ